MININCKRNPDNVIDGLYHDVSKLDLENLVEEIEARLGNRKNQLDKNEDMRQDFWLGVLESVSKATKTADPVPYLITKGYRAIHMRKRSEGRHNYVSWCPNCNEYHHFCQHVCPKCGSELKYLSRIMEDDGFLFRYTDEDLDMKITVETFVNQMYDDRDRYIAKRYMIDRADLMYDNYCKQLAFECKCSAVTVAKRITKIRRAFQLWYNQ